MPTVIYVESNGSRHRIEVPLEDNVMHGAQYNDVPGILGECGGARSCATCRCTVDEAWAEIIGTPASGAERELIEGAEGTLIPNMRLSCQIEMTAELDGLVVHLPASQY